MAVDVHSEELSMNLLNSRSMDMMDDRAVVKSFIYLEWLLKTKLLCR